MAKKLNITMLRNDLNNLSYKGLCVLRTNLKNLDYEKTVGNVLKKWGYSYTLQPDTGEFSITAAPGCYVRAELSNELYMISLEINYNGLSASSKDVHSSIVITPYCVCDCKPIFDKLVTGLQAEYAKYEAMNKGDKGAKLISSMVRPVLRKLKLSGVKVERCDEEPGYYRLVKRLLSNVSLCVKISFNDYEEGCAKLAAAIKSLPDWVRDNDGIYYTYDLPYYKCRMENTKCGLGLVKTLDGGKMFYKTPIPTLEKNIEISPASELSNILSAMGFEYSIDGGIYKIYLNQDIIIRRNNEHFWFNKLSTGDVSDEFKMDDINFIYMLKLLAIGSKSNGGYKGFVWAWSCTYKFIIGAIRSILPINVKLLDNLRVGDPHIVIVDDSKFFTLRIKSTKFMQSLYNIVEMMVSGKNFFDDLEKDQIEMLFKGYD